MSERAITKEVKAVMCDFCDEEVDIKSDGYCYSHIKSLDGRVSDPSDRKTYNVSHYYLSFLRIIKGSGWYKGQKEDDTKWIRYDFHAECFDNLMIKFIEEKEVSNA